MRAQAEGASQQKTRKPGKSIQGRSLAGLNAANFFQAEMVGVVLPVLSAFLRETHWRYDSIGIATAAAGLGTLVMQTPAGWLTDRIAKRRLLFASMAVLTGASIALIPLLSRSRILIDGLLFVSGAAQSFSAPLLAALALGLAGHSRLNRVIGANQSWNHAGNIVSALAAMALVSLFGLRSLFYAAAFTSALAAIAVFYIRREDLNERVSGLTPTKNDGASLLTLFKNRTIVLLFIAILLFHLTNAPILPTVAMYVKKLGGSDNLMTATVLTAQLVMVPVALASGRLCDKWGRKPVMAVAFVVLPLRILSYSLVSDPRSIVLLQGLDGIGAGIYGVAVVAMAADLTCKSGHFNTLMGVFATALAAGGVLGPLISGFLVQHLGFHATFYCFAAIAALGAAWFLIAVPHTRGATEEA
ncbi:MAG: MFS transporter [Acidobacteriaceae bacterium]|nr:MFS transporter [Acidobacteriaceae bacterium]